MVSWTFSVKGTIERYKKACSDAVNPPTVTEANTQVPFFFCNLVRYHSCIAFLLLLLSFFLFLWWAIINVEKVISFKNVYIYVVYCFYDDQLCIRVKRTLLTKFLTFTPKNKTLLTKRVDSWNALRRFWYLYAWNSSVLSARSL